MILKTEPNRTKDTEDTKNEESNDSDESSDNIPDFSYLKNFKSKKDNNRCK